MRMRTLWSDTGLRSGQSPFDLLGGLSGLLCRQCRGLRPCVELGPEPEDSSPMLPWVLGYLWSLPRGVSPRLKRGFARTLSSRDVEAASGFLSRESWDQWLSLEDFPPGFRWRLSHRAVPPATVVGVDPRRESRVSAGKTGSSGME